MACKESRALLHRVAVGAVRAGSSVGTRMHRHTPDPTIKYPWAGRIARGRRDLSFTQTRTLFLVFCRCSRQARCLLGLYYCWLPGLPSVRVAQAHLPTTQSARSQRPTRSPARQPPHRPAAWVSSPSPSASAPAFAAALP